MTPSFDPLLAFAEWWGRQPFVIPPSPHDGVTFLKDFTGITLFRQAPYQVQHWICRPGAEVPDHSHPTVDSVVIYVSGDILFRKNGAPSITQEGLNVGADGMTNAHGMIERVRPTDTHGATIGPNGGSFITIQHWLNGVPSNTELDWKGKPLDEDHAVSLEMIQDAQTHDLKNAKKYCNVNERGENADLGVNILLGPQKV